MGYADPVAAASSTTAQHSGATSRKPREGFRASFTKRRSFFGGSSAAPTPPPPSLFETKPPPLPALDPIINAPETSLRALPIAPAAATTAPRLHGVSYDRLPGQLFPPLQQDLDHERAEAIAATHRYHHLNDQQHIDDTRHTTQQQHQHQHQEQQQQKRRSLFPSRFKLGGSKDQRPQSFYPESQQHFQQEQEYRHDEPRSTPAPLYTEGLLRLPQHSRNHSLPGDVNDAQDQQYQESEHASISTRPHSAVMSSYRPEYTGSARHQPQQQQQHQQQQPQPQQQQQQQQQHQNKRHTYRASKKFTISAPFNFQHVTHTHENVLPALKTVDERDLTKEFWAASTYTSPGLQQPASQPNELARTLGAMGIWKSSSGARPTTPRKPDGQSQLRGNGGEDITALPGFVPPKKESAIKRRDDVDALLGLGGGGGAAASKPRKKPEGLKRSESTKPKNESSPSLLGFDFGLRPTRSHSTSSRRTEKSIEKDWNIGEDSSAAMLGFRSPPPKRTDKKKKKDSEDSTGGILGIGRPHPKRSIDSSRSNPLSIRDESSLKAKASLEQNRSSDQHRSSESAGKVALNAMLSNKERSRSESASGQKRSEVGALLGMGPRDPQRSSKYADGGSEAQEDMTLFGIARPGQQRSGSRPRQSPAPLRPRRSDEALKAIRYEVTQQAASPHMPSPVMPSSNSTVPERPKRDHSTDDRTLRDLGFAQLLYRTNSNESRHSPSNSSSAPQIPRRSEERRSRVSIDAESIYPPEPAAAPEYPDFNTSFDNVAEEVEKNVYRNQQIRYRAKQPLPSLPEQIIAGHEPRSPLQTVDEDAEYGSPVSPLMSAVNVSTSPVSPASTHSARMLGPLKSPELTGPGIPDDETWMDEIDFLYKQHAEATNDFDWDNVSMTPQRLSQRDPDKRLSLNIPSLNVPGVAGLSKKLSEGSLRQSSYLPSSRTSKDMQYIYHDFQRPRKYVTPHDRHPEEDTVAGARESPEVRVVDVDDKRHDSRQTQNDVAPLHMHGYESLAAGYLSDPDSSSSKHRKSNSNGSWESRRSGIVPKEQPGRSSHTSASSIPDLLPTRRGPKQPITSISQTNQQPHSPYQEQSASQNPMNEYAAFSAGPYAAGGSDSRPQSAYRSSLEQPHQSHAMPELPSHAHQSYAQSHQLQSQQLHQQHHHHYYYQHHQPQEHLGAADYLSLRRPETIDENAILRAAGEAVRHGRAESRAQNRTMHSANTAHYHYHVPPPPPPPPQQQQQQQQHYHQQPEERAGWI